MQKKISHPAVLTIKLSSQHSEDNASANGLSPQHSKDKDQQFGLKKHSLTLHSRATATLKAAVPPAHIHYPEKSSSPAKEKQAKQQMKRHEEGIIPHTVNRFAHFDGVRISVWGRLRRDFGKQIKAVRNRPIGGHDSMYSRAIKGLLEATGNPFELKYGRHPSRPRPYIPPFQLSLWSEDLPVTWAEVSAAIDGLFAAVYSHKVSLVELTFDTDFAFEVLVRGFHTNARHFRKFEDDAGNRTMYIGSPRSPWQVRIYEKGPRITRMEFALRSKALRTLGITQGHELLQLRTADVWRWVSWQELDLFRTGIQVGKKATNPQARACEVLLRRNPRMLSRLLSSEYRIRTRALLRVSGVGRAFHQMQGKLIW